MASSGKSSVGAPAASASRVRSSSPALASSSPAGSSSGYLAPSASVVSRTSRHSLYGNEDYLVLDLGSRVWKVGFSGESSPRAVFDVAADGSGASELWTFDNGANGRDAERECARLVKKWLRKTYYEQVRSGQIARVLRRLTTRIFALTASSWRTRRRVKSSCSKTPCSQPRSSRSLREHCLKAFRSLHYPSPLRLYVPCSA